MSTLRTSNSNHRNMKIAAIGFVLLFIVGALYVNDRSNGQRKTLHLADSLDSVKSSATIHWVDSSAHLRDQNYNARIIQLRKRLEFQDRQIFRLSKRLDSLIHGR